MTSSIKVNLKVCLWNKENGLKINFEWFMHVQIFNYQARINGKGFFWNLKQKSSQKKSFKDWEIKKLASSVNFWEIDVKNGKFSIKKEEKNQLKTSSLQNERREMGKKNVIDWVKVQASKSISNTKSIKISSLVLKFLEK